MPAAIAAPPPAKPIAAPKPATPETLSSSVSDHDNPGNYMGDIGSALADLDSADGAPPAPEKPAERQRDPVTKKFVKADEKPPSKPQEEPKPEEAPESQPEPEKPAEEPKPSNIRALGKAYDELKKERDTVYKPKLQSLEAKNKEYEKTIEELRRSAPDIKPIQERIAAVEKENKTLRQAIGFADYRQSPEFKEKYEKPYEEAWNKALMELKSINVTLADGNTRQFNANDLLGLANASVDKADEWIEQAFPRAITQQRVIGHINEVRRLADAQDKALEEAKKGAGEFQSKRTLEQQQHDAEIAKAYNEVNSQLVQKYPKWFGPDETDPQGNELLKKGFDYGSTVFDNKPDVINGENRVLTPLEKVKRLAVIKAKAANHDRLVARLKAEQKRATELEAKLAEYEKSEPPTDDAGQPGSVTNGDWFGEIESEIRKIDRR